MIRKASCCCGKCSIEVDGEPAMNALCHCNSCKRRTGSAFGWSAYFADAQVLRKTGDLKVYAITTPACAQRSFCTNCGSTLFWNADIMPGYLGIAGGCFTETPLPSPSISASHDGRCAWLGLPADWLTTP
jgi:hypothetical protein